MFFHSCYVKIQIKSIVRHLEQALVLYRWYVRSMALPGGFSVSGEAPLVLGGVAPAVTPSAEQPTTVMPPNRLSVSAELLLVMLPDKDALSTCPDSESSSPAG